jgi:hypothetical protein
MKIKRVYLVLVCLILFGSNVFSQETDINFKIRNVRLDLTSLIFIADATALVNVEYLHFSKSSLGLEPSLSYVAAGSVGGSQAGSPYIDYNIMLYSLFKTGEATSFKFTLGYTLRTTSENYYSGFPDDQLRWGVSFYWDALKYCGICVRFINALSASEYSGAGIGIGFSFNWKNED